MAQIHKAERRVVISAPVGEMHDIWSTKLSLMPTFCPDLIHSVESLQGQLGTEGCVILWKFKYEGKLVEAKQVMEVVDKENDQIVFKVIEGGALEFYKSCKCTYQASPINNVVTWTYEYEKDSEDVPEPEAYLDLTIALVKQIDANLTRA